MTTMYESPVPYEKERIHAAAVYCSDGRVGEHFDDFLHRGLDLPRYDRVALPGGPASLAGHMEARVAEQGVLDELKFLIDAHGLTRLVLIQHQECAFYVSRLGVPPKTLEALQRADLVRAAYMVRKATGLTKVEGYFARRGIRGMSFEAVEIE